MLLREPRRRRRQRKSREPRAAADWQRFAEPDKSEPPRIGPAPGVVIVVVAVFRELKISDPDAVFHALAVDGVELVEVVGAEGFVRGGRRVRRGRGAAAVDRRVGAREGHHAVDDEVIVDDIGDARVGSRTRAAAARRLPAPETDGGKGAAAAAAAATVARRRDRRTPRPPRRARGHRDRRDRRRLVTRWRVLLRGAPALRRHDRRAAVAARHGRFARAPELADALA
ncbi:hypothetical protein CAUPRSCDRAFT_12859 [Caulochytrium protostelioides]|uniref:Uncharacterized protein n=1 Tax=Caulochytrium protostelioides TaxID=1555241 RepID=A0A4P9WSS5_9FUNG|nr:hypothetical protein CAUPRSCDRAFT_12859 [Caulochytrium protostelioides]